MDDAFQRTLDKEAFFRQIGVPLVVKWECQVDREMRRDPEIREFISSIQDIPEPFNPSTAIRGGRTNSLRLYYKIQPGERMDYLDFCR